MTVNSAQPASEPVRVIFAGSTKEARWKPGDGSLLELAEQRGLSPAFGCRAGHCGDCKAAVIKGQVSYLSQPAYDPGEGHALICCSVPATGSDLHLDI
jgi:ferredoxin